MDKKLDIQYFIEQHSDWEKILAEKPYCISVSRDSVFGRNLILFKYNQIDSDFSVNLVRECRGLILDEDTLEIVCFPFMKFGNYGESYIPDIDWSTAFVSQKLDGSLHKVVKLDDGNLLVSTNGVIDAYKAPLMEQIGCPASSFGGLFDAALENAMKENGADVSSPREWLASLLEPGMTYMFELTSPWNKVVVRFNETRLNLIGVRNNSTFDETRFFDHPLSKVFRTPKVYPLSSIEECVEAAKNLKLDEEGYVVCDEKFNRCKVKSPVYVAAHHLRGENGVLSWRRALEIVKANETEEVLTYFPEYKPHFDELESKFNAKVAELEQIWSEFEAVRQKLPTRKDQAIWITSRAKNFSGFMFAMLDGKITSIRDGIWNCQNDKIISMLGIKE